MRKLTAVTLACVLLGTGLAACSAGTASPLPSTTPTLEIPLLMPPTAAVLASTPFPTLQPPPPETIIELENLPRRLGAGRLTDLTYLTPASGSDFLALLSTSGLYLYSPETLELLAEIEVPTDYLLERLHVLPDDRLWLSGRDDAGGLHLWQVSNGNLLPLRSMDSEGMRVTAWALSPDGAVLAAAGISPLGGGTVRIFQWDVISGDLVVVRDQHEVEVTTMTYSPDGALLAAADVDGLIRLWRRDRPRSHRLFQASLPEMDGSNAAVVGDLAFSPDSELLASGGAAGVLQLWNMRLGTLERTSSNDTNLGAINDLSFSPGGSALAVSAGGKIHLWSNDDDGEPLGSLTGGGQVAFSPNCDALTEPGCTLATHQGDAVALWVWQGDQKGGRLTGELGPFPGAIGGLALSPDGQMLAATTPSGLYLWRNEPAASSVQAFEAGVFSAPAISPDGSRLAAAQLEQGSIQLVVWHGKGLGEPLTVLDTGQNGKVSAMVFSDDAFLLAAATPDVVQVWQVFTNRLLAEINLPEQSSPVVRLAFAPGGALLVVDAGHGVQVWDVANQQVAGNLPGGGLALAARLQGGNLNLASATPGGEITMRIWPQLDPDSSIQTQQVSLPADVTSAGFSPDWRFLAYGNQKGKMQLWQIGDPGGFTWQLPRHRGPVTASNGVVFSADGRVAASGGADGLIWLSSIPDELPEPVERDGKTTLGRGALEVVALSKDGATLAAATSQGIYLLDPETLEVRRLIPRPAALAITGLAFAPNGNMLAVELAHHAIHIYRLRDGSQVDSLETNSVFSALAYQSSGNILMASITGGQVIEVKQVGREGELLQSLGAGASGLVLAEFSPACSISMTESGCLLAAGGANGRLYLWSVGDGELLASTYAHTGGVAALAFSSGCDTSPQQSPGGGPSPQQSGGGGTAPQQSESLQCHLVSGEAGEESSVHVWSAERDSPLKLAWSLESNLSDEISGLTFSPDSRFVAIHDRVDTLLWEPAAETALPILLSGVGGSLAFSPDGETLTTSGGEKLQVWNIVNEMPLASLSGFMRSIDGLAYAPDGQIVAASSRNRVFLWDVITGALISTLEITTSDPDQAGLPAALAFFPGCSTSPQQSVGGGTVPQQSAGGGTSPQAEGEGACLLAASHPGIVRVWQMAGEELRLALDFPGERAYSAAFSPDGKTLAAAGPFEVRVWDTTRGVLMHTITLANPPQPVVQVAFSPDGELIVAAENGLQRWTLDPQPELLETLPGSGEVLWIGPSDADSCLRPDASCRDWGLISGRAGRLDAWNLDPGAAAWLPVRTYDSGCCLPLWRVENSMVAQRPVLDVYAAGDYIRYSGAVALSPGCALSPGSGLDNTPCLMAYGSSDAAIHQWKLP